MRRWKKRQEAWNVEKGQDEFRIRSYNRLLSAGESRMKMQKREKGKTRTKMGGADRVGMGICTQRCESTAKRR